MSSANPEVIVVVAALDRQSIDRAMNALLATLLGVGATVGTAVTALVFIGVRWGLAPLDRLRKQLAATAVEGDIVCKRLDDARSPRELVPVYREFNEMLQRVAGTLERERSFADAAAHELRSPLAELRTTAEVALRLPNFDRSAAALREALAIGREMEHLVESLLLISRGNPGGNAKMCDGDSLRRLIESCLDRSREQIRLKQLTVDIRHDDGACMAVPLDAFEIIVRNLIDNAVHYTPPGGRILIQKDGRFNGTPELLVENGPVEIADADVPRLFQPFWQADRSHSDRNHVGLGLTVVERIAHASGLSVQASVADRRLCIRLAQAHRHAISE